MEFIVGAIFAAVGIGAVIYNQYKRHAELQAYVDDLEAGARAYSDELWDEVSALKAKAAAEIAELRGRLSK